MTNLEFIEKQIKQCNDFIKTLKRDEKLGFKWENVDYKEFEEAITQLQQIKNIIEAWCSIKQGIMICEDKVDEDSYYEYLQFDEELFDELESEEAGERLKHIKKALEVEE
jgi:hypothetical protein